MFNLLPSALLLLALVGCQSATAPITATDASPANAAVPTATAPAPPTGAPTAASARAAVARFVQTLPNATRYVPDSASVVEVDTHWQVLVPRTDWAQRMPNKAAFEVDKATGAVTTRPVK